MYHLTLFIYVIIAAMSVKAGCDNVRENYQRRTRKKHFLPLFRSFTLVNSCLLVYLDILVVLQYFTHFHAFLHFLTDEGTSFSRLYMLGKLGEMFYYMHFFFLLLRVICPSSFYNAVVLKVVSLCCVHTKKLGRVSDKFIFFSLS